MRGSLALISSLLLLVPVASSVMARPMPGQEFKQMMAPHEPIESRDINTVREDTLFLFAASGPGSFGMPGTDERGYTFDDHVTETAAEAGWTSWDKTAQAGEYWHLENAHLVDGHATDISAAGQPWTPGDFQNDFAMWCGRPNVCGWTDPNGYGNNWDQHLRIASADFSDSLLIEFAYTGFFEGEVWDYFQCFLEVATGDDTVLEEVFSNSAAGEGSYYDYVHWVMAADYPDADSFGDVILRFSSDGAWSDEDGLFITDYGAVWCDNFVTRADCVDITRTDLEDGEESANLTAETPPGAGDYAQLYENLYSEDPCRLNFTHAWAFFDQNTTNPDYPIPVVVYGPPYIDNRVESPILDSAHELGDAQGQPVVVDANTQINLHFWVYADLPLNPLVYYSWHVAAKTQELDCVSVWKNDNWVWRGDKKVWRVHEGDDGGFNVTQYVAESAMGGTIEGLQMALSCVDMCPFWCDTHGDGQNHTPAPFFDNARLMIINASAIGWTINYPDRLQDNFPEAADDPGNGSVAGKVRLDCAADVGPVEGDLLVIGDSTLVQLNMDLAGGIKEEYNDAAGEMRPALYLWYTVVSGPNAGVIGSAQADQDASDGIWSPWAGSEVLVDAAGATTYGKLQADEAVDQGIPQAGRFAFDFNDGWFEPGDIIHFFYRAEANNGTIETRPPWAMDGNVNLQGRYVVRCLPTAGTKILFCNDAGGTAWWREGLAYNGYSFQNASGNGGGYDIYTTRYSRDGGLSSRASIEDLAQYSVILWDSGSLPEFTVSTPPLDKTDDAGLLTDFLVNQDRDTYLWMMGDRIANDLGLAHLFVSRVLGALLLSDEDFYDDVTGIVVPKVYGTHDCFQYLGGDPWFWVDGGCPTLENFSRVAPHPQMTLAVASHEWEVSAGNEVAGILNRDPDGNGLPTNSAGYSNHVLYNPFSYNKVRDGGYGLPANTDYARYWVGQVLTCLFGCLPDQDPDAVDETPAFTRLSGNFPNPFNPKTTIAFSLSADEHVNLSVYDISGRLVTELLNGPMKAGNHEIEWSGENADGKMVASGVYFTKMNAGAYSASEKTVMLK